MPRAQGCARAACVSYAQDVRYVAIEHMDKVRSETSREAGLGHVRREAFPV